MEHVMFLDKKSPDIGLQFRTSTEGEEIELVREFINYYVFKFEKTYKKKHLAVFIEPCLESGYPDIVFVKYRPDILEHWNEARRELTTIDLKVLSQLIYSRGCSGSHLMRCLKLSERQTIESLERLLDADMIMRKNGVWRSQNIRHFYSIEQLISIEAKMGDMKRVMEQSLKNTWFASQSYVLTGVAKPKENTIMNIKKQGIGLYCKNEKFIKLVEAKKMLLPSSYLSLQFNEWVASAL